mgnify:CR=1 FL=1
MVYRILLVTTDAAAGCGLQAVLNQAGGGFVVECLDRLDDAVTVFDRLVQERHRAVAAP